MRANNKLIIVLTIVILVLVIVVIVAKKKGFIGKKDSVKVEFAIVNNKTIIEKVSASGKIKPETEVKISSDVSGEVIELFVEEGDSVKSGQLLLKIKPDNYKSLLDMASAGLNSSKANLSQAKSRLSQAKSNHIQNENNYNRNKKLYEEKVISAAEFETIETTYKVSLEELKSAEESVNAAFYNVNSAEAQVREASENLRKTTIYAPVSGTVSKLSVEKGERVVGTSQMAGTELLRIANLQSMEVRVNVNENDIVRVQVGDTALISVDSYSKNDEKYKGIVTQIANTANETINLEAVTEFEVRVRILNNSYKHLQSEINKFPFRPGMTASIDIITEKKFNIISAPISSITTRMLSEIDTSVIEKDEMQEVAFIVKKNKTVEIVKVKTGISDFDNIEILSGLTLNDTVVTGPYSILSKKLKNKDKIDFVKDNKLEENE